MKERIRAIIVEDEELARELIKNYLEDQLTVEILGEYADGYSGAKAINKYKPDLVFLDIQIPKLNGFELLELIDFTPQIIFSTAYDKYAIKAFELNAVDYLLKPYSKERFIYALEKAIRRISSGEKDKIENLLQHREKTIETLDRIVVKTGNKINIIPAGEIHYLEAQDDYVMIYIESGRFLKQKTMKYFEAHLDPGVFIRVHRSYIVNINQILQLEQYEKESYLIVMKKGTRLPVSKTGYRKIKTELDF
jgi:two-component system LytT family response regulator